MISFKQIRRFLVILSLAVSITTVIGFGSGDSWAAASPTQIAGKDAKTKTEIKSAQKADSFKAKTLEGMDNSMVNPDYQPGGKSNKVEKETLKETEGIKAEARESFN